MIARVYDALAPVSAAVLVSVGAGTAPLPLPKCTRQVQERFPGAGPLAGLHANLAEAGTPRVLAGACDMPFLTPAVLHSRCGLYRREALPLLEAPLASGHLALHALLDQLPTLFVSLPAAPLRNTNARLDLEL